MNWLIEKNNSKILNFKIYNWGHFNWGKA
jgi:hypothetical protein